MINQASFQRGLVDPSVVVPSGLTDGRGRHAGRRYDVYRNGVIVSLREALSECFPSIVKLLAKENFDNLAREFVRAQLPDTPILAQYGRGFPEFISKHPKLSHLPYLRDVAEIDAAMLKSYHSADSAGIEPQALQSLDEASLMGARFRFAPSMLLVSSQWPAGSIWHFAQRGGDKPTGGAEDVIVLRAEFDPEPFVLGTGAADVIAALQRGKPFGEAIAAGGEGFDLAALLNLLLPNNAITDVIPSSSD